MRQIGLSEEKFVSLETEFEDALRGTGDLVPKTYFEEN